MNELAILTTRARRSGRALLVALVLLLSLLFRWCQDCDVADAGVVIRVVTQIVILLVIPMGKSYTTVKFAWLLPFVTLWPDPYAGLGASISVDGECVVIGCWLVCEHRSECFCNALCLIFLLDL
jgi:hypothetical protein